MNKRFLLALLVAGSLTGMVAAEIVATASFEDNTLGALANQGGGTGWQGTWDVQSDSGTASDYTTVAAHSLTYSGSNFTVSGGNQAVMMTGSGNNASASRQLAQTFGAGTGSDEDLYYRFMLKWDTGYSNADDRCMVSLTQDRDKDGNPWWNKLRAGTRLSGGSDFVIHTDTGGPASTGPEDLQPADHDVNPSDTFMLVVKLHKAGGPNPFFYDYDLYLNPLDKDVESAEWSYIEHGGLHTYEVNWLGLIQRGLDTGDEYYVDDIVVATTWNEAVTGVPEPMSLSLLAVGSLLWARSRR